MQQNPEVVGFKIVLVGDTGVGKSSICLRYVQNHIFDQQGDQNIIKNYNATVKVNQCILNIGIWQFVDQQKIRDTTAKNQYQKLRRFSYAQADAFVIVFALNNRKSFQNAIKKWLYQVKKCCPDASIIFVGNKSDLRYSLDENSDLEDTQLLDKNTIYQKMITLQNYRYVQSSVLNLQGIATVFTEGVKQILDDQKNQRKLKKKIKLLENCNNCQII